MTTVTWYMTADTSARVVAYFWWPADTRSEASPMDEGTLYFAHRESPADVWGAPTTIASMPLAQARALAKGEGFVHEEVSR